MSPTRHRIRTTKDQPLYGHYHVASMTPWGNLLGQRTRTQLARPHGWIDVPYSCAHRRTASTAAYLYPGTSHYVDTANFFTVAVDNPHYMRPQTDLRGNGSIFSSTITTITFPTKHLRPNQLLHRRAIQPGGNTAPTIHASRADRYLIGKTMPNDPRAGGEIYASSHPPNTKKPYRLERKSTPSYRLTRRPKACASPPIRVPVAGPPGSHTRPPISFRWVVQRHLRSASPPPTCRRIRRPVPSSDGSAAPRNYIDAVPPTRAAFLGPNSFWLMPGNPSRSPRPEWPRPDPSHVNGESSSTAEMIGQVLSGKPTLTLGNRIPSRGETISTEPNAGTIRSLDQLV